jgi:hypothetical protein
MKRIFMKQSEKLCKDCIHYFKKPIFEPKYNLFFEYCLRRPKKFEKDLVSGITEADEYRLCSSERMVGWIDALIFGDCGKSGRFWKASKKEDIHENE